MNMRQHKRNVMIAQLALWGSVVEGRRLLSAVNVDPTFRCVKVNGGDIVAEFDSREEALALMLKHAKQRKAKLQVLNSNTCEVELFSEEETTV